MASQLNPYINFRGQAREAMEFYQSIFGGELTLNTFGQFGQGGDMADQIMHAQLVTPDGYRLMASDTPAEMDLQPGDNITISLSGEDGKLREYWAKLIEGGKVSVPLEKQMWGDEFGACVDRFGTRWMVNVSQPQG